MQYNDIGIDSTIDWARIRKLLMAERSPKHAHAYRSGILGILIFGGCGVHVPCVALVYFYKCLLLSGDTGALEKTIKFGEYFLLPGMILFLVFFIIFITVQISAFVKGKTPYPKWCWIFSLAFGVPAVLLSTAAGNNAFFNGLSTAWISIGDIWMTGGLLLMMNKAKRRENKQ